MDLEQIEKIIQPLKAFTMKNLTRRSQSFTWEEYTSS